MAFAGDSLLGQVKENLERFVYHFTSVPENTVHWKSLPLLEEVFRVQQRSVSMLNEFSEYFCVRLVLDEESPLATQYMDFFCDLNWLMEVLLHMDNGVARISPRVIHPDEELLYLRGIDLGLILWESLQPVVCTCYTLYFVYSLLYNSSKLMKVELKRKTKRVRMFSKNKFHCRTRTMGNVLLSNSMQGKHGTDVKLDSILGEGAFATVYLGHFETEQGVVVGDPVAVKMLGARLIDEMGCSESSTMSCQYIFEQFESELNMLVSVRHPNIVDVKGYVKDRPEGKVGMVMEKMDMSLGTFLQSGACHGKLDMIDLMLEIAKGVRFLHECGIMHRDLKPANILLSSIGRNSWAVKLADFGLAKPFFCEGNIGQPLLPAEHTTCRGTRFYMAPEVRVAELTQETATYTEKADVFSFGTICFNIMTRNPCMVRLIRTDQQLYDAIESGRWMKWLEEGYNNCSCKFLVDLISCCWKMQANKRPTFAEICLMLQQAKRAVIEGKTILETTFSDRDHQLRATLNHRLLQLGVISRSRQGMFLAKSLYYNKHKIAGPNFMKACLQGIQIRCRLKEKGQDVEIHDSKAQDKVVSDRQVEGDMITLEKVFETIENKDILLRCRDDINKCASGDLMICSQYEMLCQEEENEDVRRWLQDITYRYYFHHLVSEMSVPEFLCDNFQWNHYPHTLFHFLILLTHVLRRETCIARFKENYELFKSDIIVCLRAFSEMWAAQTLSLGAIIKQSVHSLHKCFRDRHTPSLLSSFSINSDQDLELLGVLKRRLFAFEVDAARSTLQVDESMIAFLFNFWLSRRVHSIYLTSGSSGL